MEAPFTKEILDLWSLLVSDSFNTINATFGGACLL